MPPPARVSFHPLIVTTISRPLSEEELLAALRVEAHVRECEYCWDCTNERFLLRLCPRNQHLVRDLFARLPTRAQENSARIVIELPQYMLAVRQLVRAHQLGHLTVLPPRRQDYKTEVREPSRQAPRRRARFRSIYYRVSGRGWVILE